jgi:HAD superfamily hydrolase (TIGR01490 family)
MNLALFDFDGTITTGDTLTPFVRLAPIRWSTAHRWAALPPMVVGYHAGIVTAQQLRGAGIRAAFTGASARAVSETGARYAAEMLPRMVRRVALDRFEWHRQQGDEIAVVSASLDVYLRPWCESQGVHCLCNALEETGGILSGSFLGGDRGSRKVEIVRRQFALDRYDIVYAYGDTVEDREMLALAHRPFYRWAEGNGEHGRATPQSR